MWGIFCHEGSVEDCGFMIGRTNHFLIESLFFCQGRNASHTCTIEAITTGANLAKYDVKESSIS